MFLIIILLVLNSFGIFAAEPGAVVVASQADFGEYPNQSIGNVTVEAGNITGANLSTNVTTYRWVGVIGDVTGFIVLGDDDANTMYEWTALGNLVYMSTSSTIMWASLADANTSEVVSNFSYLSGDYADNYSLTFTGTAQNIGSGIFSTISSDFANTTAWNESYEYLTYSLTDGTYIVFAGKVFENGVNFRNETADYQVILPENGTGGETASDEYFVWVEMI
ncbi:hypothetical protein JW868_00345 [Candidatus Woesearchaeota archaeon]|nr:hypothetical protein [Candidatus Woesearchaeota archaeon]